MSEPRELSEFTLMARHGARRLTIDWCLTIQDLGVVDFEFTAEVLVWTEFDALEWRLEAIHPDTVMGDGFTSWTRQETGDRAVFFRRVEAELRHVPKDSWRPSKFSIAVSDAAYAEGLAA